MQELYNGYRFSPSCVDPVFNASMCLFYLSMLRQLSYEPENILDPSFAPDLSKIDGILSFGDQALVARIVNDAIKGIPIPFGMLSQNINLNNLHEFNEQDLLSALIYFGFLTYTGEGNALKIGKSI